MPFCTPYFSSMQTNGDQNLPQLRFSGDLLMELGAGIELATAAFPQLFLPMACVANVVKVCPTKLSQQVLALLILPICLYQQK